MCQCIELDPRMRDARRPSRFSPESEWQSWHDAQIDHIARIGRADLLAWWERVRHTTHPGTYGQCNCEFAGSVAYALAEHGCITPNMLRREEHADNDIAWYARAVNAAVLRLMRRPWPYEAWPVC